MLESYTKIDTVEAALKYAKQKGIFEGFHNSLDVTKMIHKVKKNNWNYSKNMIKDIINLVNDYIDDHYTADETRLQLYYVTGYFD